MNGIISHVQRFSLHDGPGVRTTVFLMGCPLRCLWCHNPETFAAQPSLAYDSDKCIHCLGCVAACGASALAVSAEGALTYDSAACAGCFACVNACPTKALVRNGEKVEASVLMTEILRDRGMYRKTGGGVTFSGGEATMQAGFLSELLTLCAEQDIHTAIDTCGLCDSEVFLSLCQKAKLVLLDLKHMDSARHRALTGAPNERILQNARLLAQNGVPVEIRVPVVPGLNDDEENLDATARFAGELSSVQGVVLLGYHKLGLSKVYGFDLRQQDPGIQSPAMAHLKALRDRFQAHVPHIPVSCR